MQKCGMYNLYRYIPAIADEFVREIHRPRPRVARRLINTIFDTEDDYESDAEDDYESDAEDDYESDAEDDYEFNAEDDYESDVEDEDIPDLIPIDDLSDLGDYDYMPDLENDNGTIHIEDDEKDG